MGGGASKQKAKQKKEKEDLKSKQMSEKEELLLNFKVADKDIVAANGQPRGDREEQRRIDNMLYKASLGSPQRQKNAIMDVLPDYMLNKEALHHAELMKRKKEDKKSDTKSEINEQDANLNKQAPGGQQ